LASAPSKTASGNGVPRQPTRLTRGRLLLATLVIFVLGGVATALDLKFITGGKPRAVVPSSLLVLDPRTLDTVRNVPGQKAPYHPPVARAAGLLWTVDRDRNRLLATAPRSRRIVRDVVVGTEPVAVATGFGSAWVANSGNGSVTRVALAGSRVETLGLTDDPTAIATGAGYVWVVSKDGRRVLRIDPETNLVTKSVRLSEPPLDIVVRAGRVLLTIGD
jgi:DNA-binding beta-propeller fold protein YncE